METEHNNSATTAKSFTLDKEMSHPKVLNHGPPHQSYDTESAAIVMEVKDTIGMHLNHLPIGDVDANPLAEADKEVKGVKHPEYASKIPSVNDIPNDNLVQFLHPKDVVDLAQYVMDTLPGSDGLAEYYPDFDTAREIATCKNEKPPPFKPGDRPMYETMIACCNGEYKCCLARRYMHQ
mmetsp:Transcript_57624/g.122256  ORF Transcript_57624/g.122256 Transcript_57624/m.122256 type:complete len:179 (+) Transcript_57624:173-709(+)